MEDLVLGLALLIGGLAPALVLILAPDSVVEALVAGVPREIGKMSWILALILVVGIYYILDLYFAHRERMAELHKRNK